MKREIDICVISEVHLGTICCNPLELLKYLKSIKPTFLIVNGNFIDKNQYRKKYFSRKHLLVIHQVMQMALEGSRVIIISGKKEKLLSRFAGVNLGNIHLRKEMILKLKGKEYLITNSPSTARTGILQRISGTVSIPVKSLIIQIRKLIFPGRSINKSKKTTGILKYLQSGPPSEEKVRKFIQKCAIYAERRGFSAIISGKIQKPNILITAASEGNIEYLNSGDWIHSLSALEFANGVWKIYTYNELDYGLPNPRLHVEGESTEKQGDVFIVRKPLSADL